MRVFAKVSLFLSRLCLRMQRNRKGAVSSILFIIDRNNMKAFIDIRFGDPVSCMSITSRGLAYGTMIGRLLYYDFGSKEEMLISELSEEYIAGIHLSNSNSVYAAIGDQMGIIVSDAQEDPLKSFFYHERLHTSYVCERSLVKMFEDRVLVLTRETQDEPICLTKLASHSSELLQGFAVPPDCMPFDFDGERLLWLSHSQKGQKSLNMYFIASQVNQTIFKIPSQFKSFAFAKLIGNQVVFVNNFREIYTFELSAPENIVSIGKHKTDVVALNIAYVSRENYCDKEYPMDSDEFSEANELEENQYLPLILSLDTSGEIKIWLKYKLVECIRICELRELTRAYRNMQFFALGYPYYIETYRSLIAVSTDIGVLVIQSGFLQSIHRI